MRKNHVFILFLCSFVFAGYTNYRYTGSNSSYEPIVMSREQLKKSIKFSSPKPIKETGKIYLLGKYLFIVEKYEGIHVINNNDRINPKQVGFINVPGCIDLAIKDGSLYVDNAVDLVTIDISDFSAVGEKSRIQNVFPELPAPDLDYVPYKYRADNRPPGTIIVKWVPKN